MNLYQNFKYDNSNFSISKIEAVKIDYQEQVKNVNINITSHIKLIQNYTLGPKFIPITGDAPYDQPCQLFLSANQITMIIFDDSKYPLKITNQYYKNFTFDDNLSNITCLNMFINSLELRNTDFVLIDCHLYNKLQKNYRNFLFYSEFIKQVNTSDVIDWSSMSYWELVFLGNNSQKINEIMDKCIQREIVFVRYFLLIYCPYNLQDPSLQSQNSTVVFIKWPQEKKQYLFPDNKTLIINNANILEKQSFEDCICSTNNFFLHQLIINPQRQSDDEESDIDDPWDFLILKSDKERDHGICKCKIMLLAQNHSNDLQYVISCHTLQLDFIYNYQVMTYLINKQDISLFLGSDELILEIQIENDFDDVGNLVQMYFIQNPPQLKLIKLLVTYDYLIALNYNNFLKIKQVKSFSRNSLIGNNFTLSSMIISEDFWLFQNNNFYDMGNFYFVYSVATFTGQLYQIFDKNLMIKYNDSIQSEEYLQFLIYIKIDFTDQFHFQSSIEDIISLLVTPFDKNILLMWNQTNVYIFQEDFIVIPLFFGITGSLVEYQYNPNGYINTTYIDFIQNFTIQQSSFNSFIKNKTIFTISFQEPGFQQLRMTIKGQKTNNSTVQEVYCLVGNLTQTGNIDISNCSQYFQKDFTHYMDNIDTFQEGSEIILISQFNPLQIIACSRPFYNILAPDGEDSPCWKVEGNFKNKSISQIKLIENYDLFNDFFYTVSFDKKSLVFYLMYYDDDGKCKAELCLEINSTKIDDLNNFTIEFLNSDFIDRGILFLQLSNNKVFILTRPDDSINNSSNSLIHIASIIQDEECQQRKYMKMFVLEDYNTISSVKLILLCYDEKLSYLKEYIVFNPFLIEFNRYYSLYNYIVSTKRLPHFTDQQLLYIGVKNQQQGYQQYTYLVINPQEYSPSSLFYELSFAGYNMESISAIPLKNNYQGYNVSLSFFQTQDKSFIYYLNYQPKFYGTGAILAHLNDQKFVEMNQEIIFMQKSKQTLFFREYQIKFDFSDSHILAINSSKAPAYQLNLTNSASETYIYKTIFTYNINDFTGPIENYQYKLYKEDNDPVQNQNLYEQQKSIQSKNKNSFLQTSLSTNSFQNYEVGDDNDDDTCDLLDQFTIETNDFIIVNKIFTSYSQNREKYGQIFSMMDLELLRVNFKQPALTNLIVILTEKRIVFLEKQGVKCIDSKYCKNEKKTKYDIRIIFEKPVKDFLSFGLEDFVNWGTCQTTMISEEQIMIYCQSQTQKTKQSFKFSYDKLQAKIIIKQNKTNPILDEQIQGQIKKIQCFQFKNDSQEDLDSQYFLYVEAFLINNNHNDIHMIAQVLETDQNDTYEFDVILYDTIGFQNYTQGIIDYDFEIFQYQGLDLIIIGFANEKDLYFQFLKKNVNNTFENLNQNITINIRELDKKEDINISDSVLTFLKFVQITSYNNFKFLLGTQFNYYELEYQKKQGEIAETKAIYIYRKYYKCLNTQFTGKPFLILDNSNNIHLLIGVCFINNTELNPLAYIINRLQQTTQQNYYIQLFKRGDDKGSSWPIRMAAIPYLFQQTFNFIAYQQYDSDNFVKLLVYNTTHFLVDYNVSDNYSFLIKFNSQLNGNPSNKEIESIRLDLTLSNAFSIQKIPMRITLQNYNKSSSENFWFLFLIILLSLTFVIIIGLICYSMKKRQRKKERQMRNKLNKKNKSLSINQNYSEQQLKDKQINKILMEIVQENAFDDQSQYDPSQIRPALLSQNASKNPSKQLFNKEEEPQVDLFVIEDNNPAFDRDNQKILHKQIFQQSQSSQFDSLLSNYQSSVQQHNIN